MLRLTTNANYGLLTSLTCILLPACWESASDDDSDGVQDTSPPTTGTFCTSSTISRANALPQVNGAFCFGVAISGSEFLSCVHDGNQTQCVDTFSGDVYLVTWLGSRGTATGAAGETLGTVEQLDANRYAIALVTSSLGAVEPVGECTLQMSVDTGIAKFCTYE